MVPADQLDALYASTLRPRLDALDGLRREVKRTIVRSGILIGVPIGLFLASDVIGLFVPGGSDVIAIAAFALIFVGVLVAGFRYLLPGATAFLNYRARFKRDVVSEIFRIVCPTATYDPAQGLAQKTFDDPGLFRTRGGFSSDDRVRGTIGVTPFEAADVSRSYSTGGKNSRTVVVFRGLFVHLDFNKTLRGRTLVEPENGSASSLGPRAGLQLVALENPAFEQAFRVYATDEVEARYILTPTMMEQILSLRATTAHPIYLAFTGSSAYLGVHYGRALFEPAIAESTSLDALREMAAHFALAETIVGELDLNTRIWTKGVDRSLLDAPDATPATPLGRALAQGPLSADGLWDEFKTQAGADTTSAPSPKPPGATTVIEESAGSLAIDYPLSAGFIVALLMSCAAALLWLSALPHVPDALGFPSLRVLTTWAVGLPVAASLSLPEPHVWFLVTSVVGPIAALIWIMRVRRVEVGQDAVLIWRGLRPWPRRYSRPPFDGVMRLDGAVYITERRAFRLVNPTASPMLPVDEARWVAAEMSRAFAR